MILYKPMIYRDLECCLVPNTPKGWLKPHKSCDFEHVEKLVQAAQQAAREAQEALQQLEAAGAGSMDFHGNVKYLNWRYLRPL